MKILFLFILLTNFLFGLQTSDRLFDCTEIFKERKSELLIELERIDEQKQALSALQSATEELLAKKETRLNQKEEVVDRKLLEITIKEKSLKDMLERNEIVLKEIKELKMNKMAQTFSKMKPASAANILSDMELQEIQKEMKKMKIQEMKDLDEVALMTHTKKGRR